jgi:type I restriction enzyme, R subunit
VRERVLSPILVFDKSNLFDQVVGDLKTDETLTDQARNNTMDQFRYAFDPKAMAAFLGRMERNQKISAQFMANEELRKVALE